MIELALTLPMLLLLVLGTVDLGLGFKTYIALSNAAREGVRWVSIHPDDLPGAETRLRTEAANVGLNPGALEEGGYTISFSPAKTTYAAGDELTVAIDYEYQLLFGAVTGLPKVPFKAQATMVVLYDPVTP